MELTLSPNDLGDYQAFLRVKSLPVYRFEGRTAIFPDEYAGLVTGSPIKADATAYRPSKFLWDYQRDIARMAIAKGKYACFCDCGLGKHNISMEFAKHAAKVLPKDRAVLLVSPLMVIDQALGETEKWYGNKIPIEQVRAADLAEWMTSGKGRIGITNYEALHEDIPQGRLGALILDESSMLKSHYGKWGQECIRLGKGLDWKLALTGTPAPNDRIEFANHAVFLDQFPTVNSFLARFFVNRGQTDNRWELKAHAIKPFYQALSHWAIFLTNPAVYGWKDNCGTLPPINVHVSHVPSTSEQRESFMDDHGALFVGEAGGIGSRGKIARLGKGFANGERIASNKTRFVQELRHGFPDESAIIWCKYNQEQDDMAAAFPDAGNVTGDTPMDERKRIIEAFKAGTLKTIITKSKIMGFGLNLQICTRMIFSGLQDSYEEFYQCVKRANRYGSKLPLNVHIPATEYEAPMIETVLDKAHRVAEDAAEQERIFAEYRKGLDRP